MAFIPLHGRFGRCVPLWLRCLLLGLGVSWVVAMGHWGLVECGVLPRLRGLAAVDADASGLAVAESAHRALTGLPPHNADPPSAFVRYEVIAYGWPIANWGTIFRHRHIYVWQAGLDPVLAVDMRAFWPPADLPDPYRPTLTKAQIAAQCAAGACPPSNGTDAYQRYLPIFPLAGHSLLASVLYGLPFFIWFKRRELRRRRGTCANCGFSLAGLAPPALCPECGTPSLPTSPFKSCKGSPRRGTREICGQRETRCCDHGSSRTS